MFKYFLVLAWAFFLTLSSFAKPNFRARDLGIEFDSETGPLNAITDVPGVGVKHLTLIEKEGGNTHAIRTGITAVFPKAHDPRAIVPGATGTLNGNGEMSGAFWIQESGGVEGPILLTNTYSLGVVRDGLRAWAEKKFPNHDPDADDAISLPIVAETFDGFLNDIKGMHLKPKHVEEVLKNPSTGAVAEGSVGGGTGMVCFEFKCGIGTTSRKIKIGETTYTLGILVQANFATREKLLIQGKKVGKKITDLMPEVGGKKTKKDGSILVILATDIPLLPNQLKKLTARIPLGIGKTGGVGADSSGDIFLAFSTVTPSKPDAKTGVSTWKSVSSKLLSDVYEATIEGTEEAILNSLVAGRDMVGVDGNKVYGIPLDRLKKILK